MHEMDSSSDPIPEALRHLEAAYAFRKIGHVRNALAEVELACEIAPEWPDPHYLRGLLLGSLGRDAEAGEAFERAAWLDPSLRPPPQASRHTSTTPQPADDSAGDLPGEGWTRVEHISVSPYETTHLVHGYGQAVVKDPARHVPWTARDAWIGLAAAIAISIGVPFGLWALIGTLSLNEGTFLSVMFAASPVLWVVPIWWFGFRKYHIRWGTLGFRRFGWVNFGVALALLCGAYFLNVYYSLLLEHFDVRLEPDLEPITEDISAPWLILVGIVISAPIMEEIFFRGFVFAGFRQRYGWRKAALISSLIFAALHFELVGFPFLFLLGYALAYLYHRSGSIWPSIFLHFVHNGIVTLVMIFE